VKHELSGQLAGTDMFSYEKEEDTFTGIKVRIPF
jgi:hypothetical protein